MGIYLCEHPSSGYKARTELNANESDITIAFTVDENTAGELLTRKCATEEKYGRVDLNTTSPTCAARNIHYLITTKLCGKSLNVINIAGNGIHTLNKHDWTQQQINQYLFKVFTELKEKWNLIPLKGIRSGGQTGVDIAGVVIAYKLGLNAIITFPKGFIQRGTNGKDFEQTKDDVRQSILMMAEEIN